LHSRIRILKSVSPAAMALALLIPNVGADSIKPTVFGPFFMNQITVTGSPAGYEYVLTNGSYHFQVGWIEPLSENSRGLFGETYFETNGNLNVSPFTSDIGTTFNLKPLKYLEIGLSYNRMMFHNSMVTFSRPGSNSLPSELVKPENILSDHKEPGGADIFTYQANLTFDIGRTQTYLFASRALWDIDAKGKDFVFDYGDDLPIRTRDRVNFMMAQFSVDLKPWSLFNSVSFMGIDVRDQYWITTQSKLERTPTDMKIAVEKNLVSVGITGFRFGRNPERQRRGLDLFVGYWTNHYQIPEGDIAKSILLTADWKWNIHFLKM
jgi:hypothetical protein